MASPTLELTGAVVAALKADAGLTALIGDRVYDLVPAAATFPYVSIGDSWELEDDVDCVPGANIGLRLDAWSRATGYPEVLRVADAVKAVLHEADLTLTVNAFVSLRHQRTDKMRDPDGLTSHAAIEFTAIIETP